MITQETPTIEVRKCVYSSGSARTTIDESENAIATAAARATVAAKVSRCDITPNAYRCGRIWLLHPTQRRQHGEHRGQERELSRRGPAVRGQGKGERGHGGGSPRSLRNVQARLALERAHQADRGDGHVRGDPPPLLRLRTDEGGAQRREQAEIGFGDIAAIEPDHDAWFDGDEACVAVDFGGYARHAAGS